jgi:YD repeat-containing protein
MALTTSLALLLGGAGKLYADSAQYFYDPAGRLIAVIDPVNGSAQYTYDAVGNILSVVRRSNTDIMVAQVSPSQGVPGAVVTVSGTGFDTTADTTVSFNGQPATPIAVTATQLTVAVPSGAVSGPISVTSPAGTATSVANFTVPSVTNPVISGVSPTQIDQGGTITITGSGFDPVPGNNKIFVNGRYAALTAATSTTLTAVVPAATSGRVTVATASGSSTTSDDLIVPPLPFLASSIGAVVQSAIGSSPTVSLSTAGQVGVVLFDATAGQKLTMLVSSSSFSSATIALYGPDGALIGPVTGISTGTFFDNQTLPANGTYTVVVAPASTATGSASISLISTPDVTATIAADATPVSLTTTITGQNMSLTFSGVAGQRVSLAMQYDASFSLICNGWSITEPNVTSFLFNGLACNTSNFTDSMVLPATGTYTIAFNPTGTPLGSATFTLYSVPADASSAITTDGTPVSLTTTVPGQNMSLTFSGTAGQRVSLFMQYSGNFNIVCNNWNILEPDGTTQLFNSGTCGTNNFTDVLTLPQTGTYTIAFNPSGSAIGGATFTLWTVPADASSPIAANGTPVSLTTTAPGQNMSLTFTATAGQRVSLVLQYAVSFNSICNNWSMLEPDGTSYMFNGQTCGTTNSSGVLVLPQTGTYKISFNPVGSAIGSATFTLATVLNVTGTIAANGTPVTLTTTASGEFMTLTFSGTAGQRVSLQMVYDPSFNNRCNSWNTVEPDGTTQLFSGGTCGRNNFTDVLILPATGTYTIGFFPGGAATGGATFTLFNDPPDASATITADGTTNTLTTTAPGQNMSLTFSGTAGQRVSLFMQYSANFNSICNNWSITEPDGHTLLFSGGTCGTNNFTDVLTLPTTGTYTIAFNPVGTATGSASFTLYNVPPDASGTVNLGDPATNYTTTAPSQNIKVTFAGTAGQGLHVNVGVVSSSPPGPCYNITTLEPDGTTVLRGDQSCGATYASAALTMPTTGTYTVIINPSGMPVGTYSLAVSSP